MAVVSVVQSNNIRIAVEEAIQLLGGIERFVQPKDKVVIKPNLVFGLPPFTGLTTDYPIVQAVIETCQKVGSLDLAIAEGSGGIDTKLAFRIGGYAELAERYSAKLIDLNESETTSVSVPRGVSVQDLRFPRIILECDVLINVPKLKLYRVVPGHAEWASLAVKNLMGVLPGKGEYSHTRPSDFSIPLSPEFLTTTGKYYHPTYQKWWRPTGEKKRIHTNLAQGLVDINTVIKPALNIIDGVIVSNDVDMTTTTAQDPFNLNTILASQDPLALDCIATRIGGLDLSNISYLQLAAEGGLGESDFGRIEIRGTQLDEIIKTWETELAN
ncbi:MAG: DUF362 domain-containing protein [Promethearchaeota archaeon]